LRIALVSVNSVRELWSIQRDTRKSISTDIETSLKTLLTSILVRPLTAIPFVLLMKIVVSTALSDGDIKHNIQNLILSVK
jgi:hypothetical protein